MKVNLVIDGNYLLNKDVHILFSEKTLYSDLPLLLRRDIERLSKMFNFDNIYFVSDSKNRWRSKVYNEYKGNRIPNENIDWNEVYEIYDELKKELQTRKSIHQYQVEWAEGDDIISYIVNESNTRGYSNVIMASDNDFHQLVKFNLGLQYMNIIYNYKISDEKTYFPKNYNIFIKEAISKSSANLFDMNDDTDFFDLIDHLTTKTKVKQVDCEESLFSKIISGDRKDNIPSVYLKKIKNDKTRGIGKDGGLSIYRLYKETNGDPINFDSDDFINKATDIVSFAKKITDSNEVDSIKNNIVFNRKLLTLSEKYIPSELMENIRRIVKIY